MAEYLFGCAEHGVFTLSRPMAEAAKPAACPVCGVTAARIFTAAPAVWHCEGSHNGDYGKGNFIGDKRTALNKQWSRYYREAPPPPAADVPRNSGEKY